jgi:alpha-L-fucosidase
VKSLNLFRAILLFAAFALPSVLYAGDTLKETNAYPAQMKWWLQARYGMFIHWDISSIAGTEISWSRKGTKPLDITGDPAGYVEDPVYDNLYKKFNPTNFNAREWVTLAKEVGMKYIVFTAKHHGGFCMWDTKFTGYNIMNTPFKRDVLKELADACHEASMPLGIYYSPRDWHQPDYGRGDNRKYVRYMNGEIHELLTNYGKIDILWWDSYGRGDLTDFWHVGETFDIVKQLQPDIVMNNRLAELGAYDQQPAPWLGDFDTPEQRMGEFQNTRAWESCMSIVTATNGGWSYRPDGHVKSYAECLRSLLSCATGDGNLLLDVGPDSTGIIPEDQDKPLRQVGAWLKKYGESIYGTRGGPYHNGSWGGSTFRGNVIYLHIRQWDGTQLKLPPLKTRIISFTCLNPNGAPLKIDQKPENVTLTLPVDYQDAIDTLVRLTLSGHAAAEMPGGKPLPEISMRTEKVIKLSKANDSLALNTSDVTNLW